MAKAKPTDGRVIGLLDAPAVDAARQRAERTFTYQHVETAILRSYGWTHVARKALGARLRNYANLGLGPAARPGKGARVAYTEEDILKWVAALELQILGMPPADAVKFILNDWPKFREVGFPQSEGEFAKQFSGGAITREEYDHALKRKIQVIQAYTDIFGDSSRLRFINVPAEKDGTLNNIPAGNNHLLVFDFRQRFLDVLSRANALHNEDLSISYVVENYPDRVSAALRERKRKP